MCIEQRCKQQTGYRYLYINLLSPAKKQPEQNGIKNTAVRKNYYKNLDMIAQDRI